MGLIVSPNTKTIKVHGTPIELTNVYVRIAYLAHDDGKTMSITFQTYYDRSQFDINELITTDIGQNGFSVEILPTEIQSIDTAFAYAITKFTEWGYNATLET
jgi:hypothetical protein